MVTIVDFGVFLGRVLKSTMGPKKLVQLNSVNQNSPLSVNKYNPCCWCVGYLGPTVSFNICPLFTQRVSNKRVTEQIFFRLMQYFAVVLFECGEAEDFTPAKSLMNMCFTFYYEGKPSGDLKLSQFFLFWNLLLDCKSLYYMMSLLYLWLKIIT